MSSVSETPITTKCSPANAALSLLIGSGRVLSLQLPDGTASLELRPAAPNEAISSEQPLTLDTAWGPIRLTGAMELLKALTAIDPVAGEPDASDWLLRVALSHLPAPLHENLGWVSLAGTAPSEDDRHTMKWLFRQGSLTLSGGLLCSTSTLHSWLAQPSWEELSDDDVPTPPLAIFCSAGHTLLPREEMESLHVGDLIAFEQCYLKAGRRIELPVADRILDVQYHCGEEDEVELELLGWKDKEQAQATEPETTATDGHGEDTDTSETQPPQEEGDCERLVFSLGEFQLSPREWPQCPEGRRIALPFSQPGRGNLIINGCSRGYGELVTINGRPGVQILQLWGRHGRGN